MDRQLACHTAGSLSKQGTDQEVGLLSTTSRLTLVTSLWLHIIKVPPLLLETEASNAGSVGTDHPGSAAMGDT